MLIRAYGLFWRRDEVPWNPGPGGPANGEVKPFSILGHVGEMKPRLKVIDVRPMHGVYVLHNNYGPYYVGLAKGQAGLGARLRAHTKDRLADHWESFSWFAFDQVLKKTLETGLTRTKHMPLSKPMRVDSLIEGIEAMLMMTLGTTKRGNKVQSKMTLGKSWKQVRFQDWDHYLARAKL